MSVQIEKIPGGFALDGLELRKGKCGCSGMGGDCCFTYSKVRREGNAIFYEGKATAPSTNHNYQWGYRVRKGDMVVEVKMEDTRDAKDFFAGCNPPTLQEWQARGWEVESRYERDLD